jgi:hypothetical protein
MHIPNGNTTIIRPASSQPFCNAVIKIQAVEELRNKKMAELISGLDPILNPFHCIAHPYEETMYVLIGRNNQKQGVAANKAKDTFCKLKYDVKNARPDKLKKARANYLEYFSKFEEKVTEVINIFGPPRKKKLKF